MTSNLVGTEWLRKQTKKIDDQSELSVDVATAAATQIEAWLQRREIRYAPPVEIPMSLIDTKKSRANQARREPLVAESVDRFASAFRQGSVFPPIVVYQYGSKLVIIDGNNRHEAALRAKKDSISGIIIDEATDSDMITLLTVEANTSHGVTPATEWRIRQAFHLCTLGHTDEDAAQASGITVSQLRNARSAAEAEQRAKFLRIHGFSELPAIVKQQLNGIKMEAVFHGAAGLAAEHKMTGEQVRSLCRAIKTAKSESEQLAVVAEQRKLIVVENAASKALSKRVNSPKTSLIAGIGLVSAVNIEALISQIRTTTDRDIIKERVKKMEERVLALQIALESLDLMDKE